MSELQERLAHLINYSSQLIFVSGDSIAQQQRALEDFLSIQQENTEISYFTSELTMESPDFRRIICRQLLGQKVGSFVRPLNELLKDLHEQPGPYLLCIKQAQTLPNAFLQELWDWVTESKKQSTDHHVNVILFGESAWAEKAKKWLPKRNSSRPVLLSSQSVDSSKFDVNALESLMAHERPKFSLGLFSKDEFAPPIVTQKWFIASILILLLSVFVGLMSWQYPDHIKSLIQTGALPPEADLNVDELALVNQQLERERARREISSDNIVTNNGAPAQDLGEATTGSENSPPSAESSDVSEENSQIITSWEAAKESSKQKIELLRASVDETQEQAPIQSASENSSASMETSSPLEIVDADTVDIDGDFSVPDIISVEQLDASLGKQLLAPEQTQSAEQPPLEIDDEQALTSIPATQTNPNAPSYEFDEATLLALAEPSVLLQLSGIQNRSVLIEFIVDNDLQDIVWVYETTRYGGAWHVVLFNQRFDSIGAARAASANLPEAIQAISPFAKDLTQIKLEIRSR